VPQTSDGGIAVYYNKNLVEAAGLTVDDISHLTWSPSGGDDTLLSVAQRLTRDAAGKTADAAGFDGKNLAQYGYNAAKDLQAIYLNFIGSNGGAYHNPDGTFTLDNPKTIEAFEYLVDLINTHHVATSAADTNTNGNFSLDAFNQGKLALFQSGLYNLANVADNASFPWGVVNLPAGPAGAVSVTNGISVMGNAASAHPEAVAKVLTWLGSADGNQQIGSTGANLPGVLAAQQVYLDYWAAEQVDLTPFFDAIKNVTPIPAPVGANFAAGYAAIDPVLDEVFLGRTPVAEGLKQANQDANAAIAG
jgi:multiple sugar transport system substrate-binding protein